MGENAKKHYDIQTLKWPPVIFTDVHALVKYPLTIKQD